MDITPDYNSFLHHANWKYGFIQSFLQRLDLFSTSCVFVLASVKLASAQFPLDVGKGGTHVNLVHANKPANREDKKKPLQSSGVDGSTWNLPHNMYN